MTRQLPPEHADSGHTKCDRTQTACELYCGLEELLAASILGTHVGYQRGLEQVEERCESTQRDQVHERSAFGIECQDLHRAQAFLALGLALLAGGELDEARRSLERAQELSSPDEEGSLDSVSSAEVRAAIATARGEFNEAFLAIFCKASRGVHKTLAMMDVIE